MKTATKQLRLHLQAKKQHVLVSQLNTVLENKN
jgi:hypothetical protein